MIKWNLLRRIAREGRSVPFYAGFCLRRFNWMDCVHNDIFTFWQNSIIHRLSLGYTTFFHSNLEATILLFCYPVSFCMTLDPATLLCMYFTVLLRVHKKQPEIISDNIHLKLYINLFLYLCNWTIYRNWLFNHTIFL